MTSRKQTYDLQWGLFILGILGWAVVASLGDRTRPRSHPLAAASASATAPSRGSAPPNVPAPPRLALIEPTDRVLDADPVTFAAELPLVSEKLSPADGTFLSDSTALASAVATPWSTERTVVHPSTAAEPAPAPSSSPAPASGTQSLQAPRERGLPITYDSQLRAYQKLERRPDADASLDLGGLVVDETMSLHGRLFYTKFYDVWQAPPVEGFYTVRIQEEPTPGRGTLVQVFVNDDATFQTRLQPYTDIDRQSLHAARRTYAYVRSGRGILRIY